MKGAYAKLIQITQRSQAQARRVGGLLAKDAGVKRVVFPGDGKGSPERRTHERERWFRRGFRFRAGIEGRISVLRRRYGLARCPDHGSDGMGRYVGWGILTHNLVKIAQVQVAR
jgi:IS5 family transposase